MATVAALRTNYLNDLLERAEASTVPWSDAKCNQALTSALYDLWPMLGQFVYGDVATDSETQLYTVPTALGTVEGEYQISRIEVLDASDNYVDTARVWRRHSATQIVLKPRLSAGYTLRFYGWKRFAVDGSDLPLRLERAVAYKAASTCFGMLTGRLVNSQTQQGLDSGRIVDYPSAVGLSAYWEAQFQRIAQNDPSRVSLAPRRAYR
jgi:hypothetical protein